MPHWADDNTGRLICKIKVSGHVHYTKARVPTGASQSLIDSAQSRICAAYTHLEEFIGSDFTCVAVKFIPGGTSSAVPQTVLAAWSLIAGGVFPDPYQTAKYVNFVGQGIGRGSCSIKIWGTSFVATGSADDDFRRTGSENSAISLAKAALDGSEPLFVLRNGQQAVFQPAALSRVSAWWQTKLRG